jgi:predicted CoA-binding protein
VAAAEPEPVALPDGELRALLGEARTIAVVGLSSDPNRDSHQVARYLRRKGYRIIPVNPKETEVLGERAYGSLVDVPDPVDVVDVFRRAEEAPAIAREAVRIGARALWLQSGIVSEEAHRIATDGGLDVVMGVCIRSARRRLDRAEPDREES